MLLAVDGLQKILKKYKKSWLFGDNQKDFFNLNLFHQIFLSVEDSKFLSWRRVDIQQQDCSHVNQEHNQQAEDKLRHPMAEEG